MPIDRQFTIDTLREIIRIDSRNPELEEGAPAERELAEHVQRILEPWNWETELRDHGRGRASVLATRRGKGSGRSLMINVHLDTVGVAGMSDPFSAEMRDGRVYGRGAQDTKGGLAAALAMARAIHEEDPALDGDLVLAFVADEEHASIGTTDLVEHRLTDAAIVLEPSELDVCIAHRGFGIFRLRTHGRTAHGGRPDVGIDANLRMGRVLVALEGLRTRWEKGRSHPLLGAASLHVPMISGGRQLFIYSDECTIDMECRTVPGQSDDEVLAELEAILAKLHEHDPTFRADVEKVLWQPPHEIDPERPIVGTVLRAAESVREEPVHTIGHGWWEDSALLGQAGVDAVVLGPTGGGLHTEEEWVETESVVKLAEILRRSAIEYCGPTEPSP
ncbi:MAG: M20/M25/M40 family metallo-hydrolase [Gemmatimonadota bacterium]|nr:M20/M25/M40 family metallo-hydrolase [Gemmatimonadota bacterium]